MGTRVNRFAVRSAPLLRFRNNRNGTGASVHHAGYLGSSGHV
jgi:hypothetical protein